MKQYDIHAFWLGHGEIFLYAMEEGLPARPSDWVPLLFQWHTSSWYGTGVATGELLLSQNRKWLSVPGVKLDAFGTLELFSRQEYNRFADWSFDPLCQRLFLLCPILYERVLSMEWETFPEKPEGGRFRWKLPERIIGRFTSQFWKEELPVYPKYADTKENPPPIPVGELARQLYENGIRSFLDRRPAIKNTLTVMAEAFRESEISAESVAAFLSGGRYFRWMVIGKNTPIQFELHLTEPSEEEDPWRLASYLRERKKGNRLYPLSLWENGSPVPKRMRPFIEEAMDIQWHIGLLFPWLLKEEYAHLQRPVLTGSTESPSGKQNGEEMVKEIARSDSILNKNVHAAASADEAFKPDHGRKSSAALFNGKIGVILKEELSEEEAWKFLTEVSEVLLKLGIDILLPPWWKSLKERKPKLKAKVSPLPSGRSFIGLNALMDFDWRIALGDTEMEWETFEKLMAGKRKWIRWQGRWFRIDPEFIATVKFLMEKAEKEGIRIRDVLEQELTDREQKESEKGRTTDGGENEQKIELELHPKVRSFVQQLAGVEDLPSFPVPKGLRGTLRPYQVKGMNWLYFMRSHHLGACLADDMGLGKTVQLIAYLLLVKEREGDSPSLIICPTSVLGNWQKELERFSPGLSVYLHYGANRFKGEALKERIRSADVVLTTYGLSVIDFDGLAAFSWGAIILDEAQNIKNPETKQSRAIRKLKGTHHIALTGTPIENRLTELWSIFDFLNKGYLGSLHRFREQFALPIERDHDAKKLERLRRLIRPFLLRRTKTDPAVCLNLPEKLEQKEYLSLTAEQATLYKQLIRSLFDSIATLSGMERRGLILKILIQLKQLCDHPVLFLKEKVDSAAGDLIERSAKLEKLVELCESMLEQKESGLIFTQYLGMGRIIRIVLEQSFGVPVPFLQGSLPKAERDNLIARFQERQFPFLLLSLRAGGTGLNLTAANHVIHVDRWWNPAVENQATDRAYRIGQSKFVHVHKFISTGTLEEKIDRILEEKQLLSDEIIKGDHWLTELENDELYKILRLES